MEMEIKSLALAKFSWWMEVEPQGEFFKNISSFAVARDSSGAYSFSAQLSAGDSGNSGQDFLSVLPVRKRNRRIGRSVFKPLTDFCIIKHLISMSHFQKLAARLK